MSMTNLMWEIRQGAAQRAKNQQTPNRRRRRKPRKRKNYANVPTYVLDQYLGPFFYNESQEAFGKFDFQECVLKAKQLGLRVFICGRDDVGSKIYTFGNSFGFAPIEYYRYVTKDLEGREIVCACNDFETLQNLEFGSEYCLKAKHTFYFNRGKYHILRHMRPYKTFYNRASETYLCQGTTFMDRETELMLEEVLLGVFEDQYYTVRHILEYCMETKRHALVVHQFNHVTFLIEAPLEECVRVEKGKETRVLPVGENVTVVMTRVSKLLDGWTEEMEDRNWDAKKIKKLMKKQDSIRDQIIARKKPTSPAESSDQKREASVQPVPSGPGMDILGDTILNLQVAAPGLVDSFGSTGPESPMPQNGPPPFVGAPPGLNAPPNPAEQEIDLGGDMFPNLPVAAPGLADSFGTSGPESPMPPDGPPPFVGAPAGWTEGK